MRRTTLSLMIVSVLFLGMMQFLATAAPEAAKDVGKRFAIEEFTGEKMDQEYLKDLAVNMRKELAAMGATVMTLEETQKAIQEKKTEKPQNLSTPENAVALAKLYGAEKIIVGSIEMKDVIISITASIVDVETGKAEPTIQEKLISDPAKMKQDVQKMAYRLCKRLYHPAGVSSSSLPPGSSTSPTTPGQPEPSTMKPKTAPQSTTPSDPAKPATSGAANQAPNSTAKTDSSEKLGQ